jgi:hypothetical protein
LPKLGAFVLADLEILLDFFNCALELIAPMSVFLSSGSPTMSVCMRSCSLRQDGFVNAFLHEQARAGAADVALVEEDAVDDSFDGLVDGGVVEDNVRGLAAQFQREIFFVPGRGRWMILPTSVSR